jgi:hypothetical protein
MKKQTVWMPLILMAVFGLAIVPTKAQSANGVRAEIPFDFIVGNKTLSAGKIIVRRMTSADVGTMEISNLEDGQMALRTGLRMSSTDPSEIGKLVFRRYGNRHYLAEVWIPGYKAIQVIKSNSERALQKELRLAKNYRPMIVTVFAQ